LYHSSEGKGSSLNFIFFTFLTSSSIGFTDCGISAFSSLGVEFSGSTLLPSVLLFVFSLFEMSL